MVEDAEDVYIFWLQVGTALLFGSVGVLVYRKIKKMATAQAQQNTRVPDMIKELTQGVQVLSNKLDVIAARTARIP